MTPIQQANKLYRESVEARHVMFGIPMMTWESCFLQYRASEIAGGQMMKACRLRAGIKATEMASKIGVSARHIHAIESGQERVRGSVFIAYMDVIDPDYYKSGSEWDAFMQEWARKNCEWKMRDPAIDATVKK